MKENKFTKIDWINIGALTIVFGLLCFLFMEKNFLYGSTLDWHSQHVSFPEYFRALFYSNHDLFPDFAFNLGSGQNIYNFAYYGLLSPYTILSFFLPFINMTYYIIGMSIFVTILSTLLIYKWLRNNNLSPSISFICSLLFLFSAPIMFHSHRHIMFICYMPFLLMALMNVDSYFKKGNKTLLILNIFLMIMTSFYFSITGILCLLIYASFKYLKNNEFKLKEYIMKMFKFCILVLIAVLMAAILLLPTLHVILYNRSDVSSIINIKELLFPSLNLHFLLYNFYGLGLTGISLIALIYLFFKKTKEYIFLGITLTLLILIPIFVYILNAAMYIDSKVLIPLLPLYTLTIGIFLKELFNNKLKNKLFIPITIIIILISVFLNPHFKDVDYLRSLPILKYFIFIELMFTVIIILIYKKTKNKYGLIIPLILIAFISCIGINKTEIFVDKEMYLGKDHLSHTKLIDEITNEDKSIFRIGVQNNKLPNINRTFNRSDFYTTSIYSSISNLDYNKFYYDVLNNNIPMRNRALVPANKNLIHNTFFGNKYLISKLKDAPLGYKKIKKSGEIYLHENDKALPLIYSTDKIYNEKSFDKIGYPHNLEMLINGVLTNNKTEQKLESNLTKETFDLNSVKGDLKIKAENGAIKFDVKKIAELKYKLDDTYKDSIIFIRFRNLENEDCLQGGTKIRINNIQNTLSCKSWKYHNKNYIFDYQIGIKDDLNLKIKILKGKYKIDNIEIYKLKYSDLVKSRNDFSEFKFDMNKTKGDTIKGNINVKKDGYLVTSIPYDTGFDIKVDNERVKYKEINKAFIGFQIDSGFHKIEIEYKAPYKKAALIISAFGLIIYLIIIVLEYKRKR